MPREPGLQTNSAWLQRVSLKGQPAMLKVARPESDERPGMALLAWWGDQLTQDAAAANGWEPGFGAVRVLCRDADALVMAEAEETPSLGDLSAFDDRAAYEVLIQTARALHPHATPAPSTPPSNPLPTGLVPLTAVREHVFGLPAAGEACFDRWRNFAGSLDVMGPAPEPLHGDIHHGNVLRDNHSGAWVVIDPKGLLGHPAYDFANLFFNPMDQPGRVAQVERMDWLASHVATLVPAVSGRDDVLDFGYLYGGMSLLWGWDEVWASERLEQFQMLETLWQAQRQRPVP